MSMFALGAVVSSPVVLKLPCRTDRVVRLSETKGLQPALVFLYPDSFVCV